MGTPNPLSLKSATSYAAHSQLPGLDTCFPLLFASDAEWEGVRFSTHSPLRKGWAENKVETLGYHKLKNYLLIFVCFRSFLRVACL